MHHMADAGYRCGNRQGFLKGTRIGWNRKVDDHADIRRNQLADGKLGASFFLFPNFRKQLLQVLKTNPDVGRVPQLQLEKLNR